MKPLAIFLLLTAQLAHSAPEARLESFATGSAVSGENHEKKEDRILLIWEIRGSEEKMEFVRGRIDQSATPIAWSGHPGLPEYFIHVGDYHGYVVDFVQTGDASVPKLPIGTQWVHTPRHYFQLANGWGFRSHEAPHYFGFSIPASILDEYAHMQKGAVRPVMLSVSLEYFTVREDRKEYERAGEITLTAKNIRRSAIGEILVDDLVASEKWPDFKEFLEERPNKASEPTTPSVTPAADAPVAPAGVAAHL